MDRRRLLIYEQENNRPNETSNVESVWEIQTSRIYRIA